MLSGLLNFDQISNSCAFHMDFEQIVINLIIKKEIHSFHVKIIYFGKVMMKVDLFNVCNDWEWEVKLLPSYCYFILKRRERKCSIIFRIVLLEGKHFCKHIRCNNMPRMIDEPSSKANFTVNFNFN